MTGYFSGKCGKDQSPNKDQVELRLVQSRKDIEDPKVVIKATVL